MSPKRLMGLVRGHWGVENGLHFIKDRWWDEDRQWSVRPGLAERPAALRDAALAALRLIPGLPEDLPIRARADHLSRRLRRRSSTSGLSNRDFAILLGSGAGVRSGLPTLSQSVEGCEEGLGDFILEEHLTKKLSQKAS